MPASQIHTRARTHTHTCRVQVHMWLTLKGKNQPRLGCSLGPQVKPWDAKKRHVHKSTAGKWWSDFYDQLTFNQQFSWLSGKCHVLSIPEMKNVYGVVCVVSMLGFGRILLCSSYSVVCCFISRNSFSLELDYGLVLINRATKFNRTKTSENTLSARITCLWTHEVESAKNIDIVW